jgi:hypothetical protein
MNDWQNSQISCWGRNDVFTQESDLSCLARCTVSNSASTYMYIAAESEASNVSKSPCLPCLMKDKAWSENSLSIYVLFSYCSPWSDIESYRILLNLSTIADFPLLMSPWSHRLMSARPDYHTPISLLMCYHVRAAWRLFYRTANQTCGTPLNGSKLAGFS